MRSALALMWRAAFDSTAVRTDWCRRAFNAIVSALASLAACGAAHILIRANGALDARQLLRNGVIGAWAARGCVARPYWAGKTGIASSTSFVGRRGEQHGVSTRATQARKLSTSSCLADKAGLTRLAARGALFILVFTNLTRSTVALSSLGLVVAGLAWRLAVSTFGAMMPRPTGFAKRRWQRGWRRRRGRRW